MMNKSITNKNNDVIVVGFKPHPGQLRIIREIENNNSFYNIVKTSRQFGKTTMMINLALYYAINIEHSFIAYFTPFHHQARYIMDLVKNSIYLGNNGHNIIKSINTSRRIIEFINHSKIFFCGVDKAENIRGLSVDFMFIDEFAFIDDNIFFTVLNPMLTVKGKRCFICSTPFGVDNDFYKLYNIGLNDGKVYSSYSGTYLENPYYNKNIVESAKKVMHPDLFKQEFEGEFVGGINQFFNILPKCEYIDKNTIDGYYITIDFGLHNDYTVICIIGVIEKENKTILMDFERFNGRGIDEIISVLIFLHQKYGKIRNIIVEENGIGLFAAQELTKRFNGVMKIYTNQETKLLSINRFRNSIERNQFTINENIPQEKIEQLFKELKGLSIQLEKGKYKFISKETDDILMSISFYFVYFGYDSTYTIVNKGRDIIAVENNDIDILIRRARGII